MPRDKEGFKNDIKTMVKDASKKAYLATFNIPLSNNETKDSASEKAAKEFAKVFSNEFAPKLAQRIDKQIDDQTFITTALIAPSGGGPCTGEITST